MSDGRTRRWVALVGLAVLLLGIAAAIVPIDTANPLSADDWVRTVDGWERAEWRTVSRHDGPGLHPAVPAIGMLLLAVLALAGFPHPQESAAAWSGPPHPVTVPHFWRSSRVADAPPFGG